MADTPQWRLARRAYHPFGNLDFASWNGLTPKKWTWTQYHAGMSRYHETWSSAVPVPFMGKDCWRHFSSQPIADSAYLFYEVDEDLYPEMYESRIHSIRATCRVVGLWSSTRIVQPVVYVGSEGTADPLNWMTTGHDQDLGVFWTRHVNSWLLLETNYFYWSNSKHIQFEIRATTGVPNFAIDDVRLFCDEILIDDHRRRAQGFKLNETSHRTLNGKRFTHRFGERRTWKLPLEHISSGGWENIERWHAEDAKLWITDPACNSYPAVFTSKNSPIQGTYPGRPDLRQGELMIEADYHHRVLGNTGSDPYP